MHVHDLESIRNNDKTFKSTDDVYELYDMTKTTFIYRNDIKLNYYYVQEEDEMRIDLICYKIYKSLDHMDVLLNINNIDNPLNIKCGDIIKYPIREDIEKYKLYNKNINDGNKNKLSFNKNKHKDENRENYIKNNYSIPPTVLENPLEPVVDNGDYLIIGQGLF